MNVYFVSGLAADSRVFKNIRLPNHCVPVFLEWIDPLPAESLKSYALRLAAGIDTRVPFALVGLSMGGMIVSEIATQHKPAVMILISSISCSGELPFYLKAAGKIRLHRLVPVELVKSAAKLKRLFTRETTEDKAILLNIIQDSDNAFIHWAMHAILQWKNDKPSLPYIHIHGTRDEILPMRLTRPTHIVKKGGHLMVMTRAKEINLILDEILAEQSANHS